MARWLGTIARGTSRCWSVRRCAPARPRPPSPTSSRSSATWARTATSPTSSRPPAGPRATAPPWWSATNPPWSPVRAAAVGQRGRLDDQEGRAVVVHQPGARGRDADGAARGDSQRAGVRARRRGSAPDAPPTPHAWRLIEFLAASTVKPARKPPGWQARARPSKPVTGSLVLAMQCVDAVFAPERTMLERFLPTREAITQSRMLRWPDLACTIHCCGTSNRRSVARGVAMGVFFGLMIPDRADPGGSDRLAAAARQPADLQPPRWSAIRSPTVRSTTSPTSSARA